MRLFSGTHNRLFHRTGKGFSLVELMISAALISVMAAALGMALHRSQQRQAKTHTSLSRIRQTREILRLLQDDLRVTHNVSRFSKNSIAFTVPKTGGGWENHHYYINASHELYRRINLEAPQLIARQVYVFTVELDKEAPVANTRLYRVRLSLQIGPDADNLMCCDIDTLNRPDITDSVI